MHNFAICLIEDNKMANTIFSEVINKIKSEIPQSNISVFTSSHGNFNIDCGVFCLAELWYFSGELLVFDANTLELALKLKQNMKLNFVFMGQRIDLVKLMNLLDDSIINIAIDKTSYDNFYRLTGRKVMYMDQYIQLHKNIKDRTNE